jgi:hypothetical protein
LNDTQSHAGLSILKTTSMSCEEMFYGLLGLLFSDW